MTNKKNQSYVEQIDAVTNWEELQSVATLDEVKSALRQREVQRLAHKKYYLRRQLILEKAREAGITV